MSDFERAVAHAKRAQHEGREISDACARVIGSFYHEGQASISYSFASTGTVPEDTSELWHEMFMSRQTHYQSFMKDTRLVADMLGTYLLVHRGRGPVSGWSRLWL